MSAKSPATIVPSTILADTTELDANLAVVTASSAISLVLIEPAAKVVVPDTVRLSALTVSI